MESCPICQKVYTNWEAHVRSIGHQEAQVRRNQEREALHNRREAPRPSRPRSPFGSLKDEILGAANDLRADKLSHTDVANWLLALAERLERK
jgi:hypothetical protein